MDIFQPDLENAIAKYLRLQTGKEWQVKAQREHMSLQFVCTCEDWERPTRSIDLTVFEGGIRMHLDELLAYWRTNNSKSDENQLVIDGDKLLLHNSPYEKITYDVMQVRSYTNHPTIKFTKQLFIDFIDGYARWYHGDGQIINGIKVKINEGVIESFKNEMINEPYLLVNGIKTRVEFIDD